MIFQALLTVVLVFSCGTTYGRTPTKSCTVPISRKGYQWPLIFKQNFELYPATKTIVGKTADDYDDSPQTVVNIPNGEEVYFSCAPNYLRSFSQKHFTKAKCQGTTNEFTVGDSQEAKNSSHFVCDLRVIEEIITQVEGCDKSGLTSTKFGYVPLGETTKRAILVGEACYDEQQGFTRFGHVKLGGAGVSELELTSSDVFRRAAYPGAYYKSHFFRALHFDELYDSIRDRLKIKDAPFFALHNYIDDLLLPNPQFQPIKKLSWNYYLALDELQLLSTLKADIKKVAEARAIDVYVGSHGVKVLHGNGAEKMELYLKQDGDKHRFPIPALIWFLVKKEQQATGFIVFNDKVFDEREIAAQQQHIKCQNSCDKFPWLVQTLAANVEERRGLLCCTYAELKAAIEEVPDLKNIKGLFV